MFKLTGRANPDNEHVIVVVVPMFLGRLSVVGVGGSRAGSSEQGESCRAEPATHQSSATQSVIHVGYAIKGA